MASAQHDGSPLAWRAALDDELRHLHGNLSDPSLAAGLYVLLDGPVTRVGTPAWTCSPAPELRRAGARAARCAAATVYALAGAGAAAAAASAGHRVAVGALAGVVLAVILLLVVEVPLHRARPVRLRTDVARYLVAEAVLAARDVAACPAGATARPAVDALLREVLRSARRLDTRLLRSAPGVDPAGTATARYSWLLEQVAALRVTAQRSGAVRPGDVVLGI